MSWWIIYKKKCWELMRTMGEYFIQYFINDYDKKEWVEIKEPAVEPTHSLKISDLKTLIVICKVFYELHTTRRLSVTHLMAFPTYKPTKDLKSRDLQVGQSSTRRIAFTEIWSWELHFIFLSNTSKIANLMCKPYLPIISEFLRNPGNDMGRFSNLHQKFFS